MGFELSSIQLHGLQVYLETLEKWNRAINLVGPGEWKDILHRLVVDSLHLSGFLRQVVQIDAPLTLDLGAGAGLPGIPLRLLWEPGEYHLVESRSRRCAFMRRVIADMGLQKTYVVNDRVENLPGVFWSSDLIVSRAFMPWKRLLAFAGSMLNDLGVLIVLSNEEAKSKDLPGFVLREQFCYQVLERQRCFWALQKKS